jgi:hypothetical protein
MANPRQEEKSTHNVDDTVRRTNERATEARRASYGSGRGRVAHPRIHFDMSRVSHYTYLLLLIFLKAVGSGPQPGLGRRHEGSGRYQGDAP